MDCGTTLVKYVLFIFNTIVSIIGVVAICYGVIVLNSVNAVEIHDRVQFPVQAIVPIGLIAIGSIVVLISFCGCCGAIRENVTETMCYAVFMFILLILQSVALVLLWTNKEEISRAMGKVIESAWETESRQAGVFEAIQKSLKCCGVNGVIDYTGIVTLPPPSCCHNDSCVSLNFYGGCRQKFVDLVTGSTDNAKYFSLGLIAVELIGFIFACCLANNIRNYKRRNIY